MHIRFSTVFALSALSATLTLAGPVFAQGTRLSEPAGGFSYTVPAGWQIKTLPGLKYRVCYAAPSAGFAPNINIVDEVAAMPLDTYVRVSLKMMQKGYTNLHMVSTTSFPAAAGLVGRRMAITGSLSGRSVYQVFYFFPAANNRKIIATATWLTKDGTKYVAPTNAAMKTFKLQ